MVKNTVKWLMSRGFKPVEAFQDTNQIDILMTDPSQMITQSLRLKRILEMEGLEITAMASVDENRISILAHFDPTDNKAIITLSGLTDAVLRDKLGLP
jgi:hypothetical protein